MFTKKNMHCITKIQHYYIVEHAFCFLSSRGILNLSLNLSKPLNILLIVFGVVKK